MAPDGVSLPAALSIAQGGHARLSMVLVTLFITYHPTVLEIKEVKLEIMERETELKEYNPHDREARFKLPVMGVVLF